MHPLINNNWLFLPLWLPVSKSLFLNKWSPAHCKTFREIGANLVPEQKQVRLPLSSKHLSPPKNSYLNISGRKQLTLIWWMISYPTDKWFLPRLFVASTRQRTLFNSWPSKNKKNKLSLIFENRKEQIIDNYLNPTKWI